MKWHVSSEDELYSNWLGQAIQWWIKCWIRRLGNVGYAIVLSSDGIRGRSHGAIRLRVASLKTASTVVCLNRGWLFSLSMSVSVWRTID